MGGSLGPRSVEYPPIDGNPRRAVCRINSWNSSCRIVVVYEMRGQMVGSRNRDFYRM